jgi:hypothetical protein
LQQNYLNPFNSQTAIPFDLATSDLVGLRVLDLLGQTVVVLANEVFAAGNHVIAWDGSAAGRSLATGVYFHRLCTGGRDVTRRMLLLR